MSIIDRIVIGFLRGYAPDREYIRRKAREAIQEDREITDIIYEVLKKTGFRGRATHLLIRFYRDAIDVFNSKEGRAYLKKNIDAIVDYGVLLARSKKIVPPK
jgi:hypothetical protein